MLIFLNRLANHLEAISPLADRIDVINALRIGSEEEAKPSPGRDAIYHSWLTMQIDLTLTSETVQMKSERDGTTLSTLAREFAAQDVFNKYDFPQHLKSKLIGIEFYQP